MRIAFLNLCHCEPEIVARTAAKLTRQEDFDMYVHVDAKQDIAPFEEALKGIPRVFMTKKRHKVYWGGYHAIEATYTMLRQALASDRKYDYFVILQNLDYPIKSNAEIASFFQKNKGKEFIRGCRIANTKDWHYARKYKIYNKRDDDFYIKNTSKFLKLVHDGCLALCSITTIGCSGVLKERGEKFPLYYGAAQWAVTRECAEYLVEFEKTHPKFNKRMHHIQFPDEEYFHTIVHNSKFKYQCIKYDEPQQRWLVNWRNLHYFEYPKEITVFDEQDYEKLMAREELFIRKVRMGKSETLLDMIDKVTQ